MVEAKCPHCGNTSFQLTHHVAIQGDSHNHHLTVCTRCQAPFAIMSQIDPGVESRRIKEELSQIHVEVQGLAAKVGRLTKMLEPQEKVEAPG